MRALLTLVFIFFLQFIVSGAVARDMKTSDLGVKTLKELETLQLVVYECSAGVRTIGWGHRIHKTKWIIIGLERAEQILSEDLDRVEARVNKEVKVPLTQGQFDALVLFTYNVGEGGFKKSTLLKKINAHENGWEKGVEAEFRRWVYVKRKKLPGLVKRREIEIRLWRYR